MINIHLFNREHFYRDRLTYCGTPELRMLENFQIGFMGSKWSRKNGDPKGILEKYINIFDGDH